MNNVKNDVVQNANKQFDDKYPPSIVDNMVRILLFDKVKILSEKKKMQAEINNYFSTIVNANNLLKPKYHVKRRNMFHKDRWWEYPTISRKPDRPTD